MKRFLLCLLLLAFAPAAYAQFPTTGLLDDFNRTDEGPPPSADWANDCQNDDSNGCNVFGNELVRDAGGGTARWTDSTFGPDTEVFVTISSIPGTFAKVKLYARIDGSQNNSYYLQVENKNASQGHLFFYKWTSGTTRTEISSLLNNNSVHHDEGDIWGFEVIGSTLTAYKDAGSGFVQIHQTTDTDITAAGNICLSPITVELDDFSGGTVVVSDVVPKLTLLGVGP